MLVENEPPPAFNLWTEPWIGLERPDGTFEQKSIREALLQAHEYMAIHDPSPLAIVGIHRLLVAILQAALGPRTPGDCRRICEAGSFPHGPIEAFGASFSARFDLFSATAPFLQSADLPLVPGDGAKLKSVAYLATEIPAGTEITHYRHGSEDDKTLCPACAAAGLVTIPAFATSGGAGIRPSINGVPPIYVIPGGKTLFDSLAASLIAENYQPEVRCRTRDAPCWDRDPVVGRGSELDEVGYLHSLTFPARRVRLHPERSRLACSRCGRISEWAVRTMVFEMGESRPKGSAFWRDPFAAYRLPSGRRQGEPTPIRPSPGKALWRESVGLFLQGTDSAETGTSTPRILRPRVLDQIAELDLRPSDTLYPVRCVGVRTDMKAKVFEWLDASFEVPFSLLNDVSGKKVVAVEDAVRFSEECSRVIVDAFRKTFGGVAKNQERHKVLRSRMEDDYWGSLAEPFRQFLLLVAVPEQLKAAQRSWTDTVVLEARRAFAAAAEAVGDDAESLRRRAQGEQLCALWLGKKRKERLPNE
mgnify:CR=1 FL=1